jgi:O-acetyl-ADP-ribose deacetylase (regulator of RNase III)
MGAGQMADAAEESAGGGLEEREGDLLLASEQYIVHQTNCRSRAARGLAWDVNRAFPHANVYSPEARRRRGTEGGDRPGTIAVMGENGAPSAPLLARGVICLFGQRGPGGPRRMGDDGAEARLRWFRAALGQIAELPGLESLAFPAGIGCGLGGGAAEDYRAALEEFAGRVSRRGVRVVMYRRPP